MAANAKVRTSKKSTNRTESRVAPEKNEESVAGADLLSTITKLVTHTWKITGVTPLMQSNPECMYGADDKNEITVSSKTYDDENEAKIRAYRTREGLYVHPSVAFRKALIAVCLITKMKFSKQSARNIVAASVWPLEDQIIILDKKGTPADAYEIDKRSVVIQQGSRRNRIMRCRPLFRDWRMDLMLTVDHSLIPLDHVTGLLNLAGRMIGIGENRPDPSEGKKGIGTNGKFIAEMID